MHISASNMRCFSLWCDAFEIHTNCISYELPEGKTKKVQNVYSNKRLRRNRNDMEKQK